MGGQRVRDMSQTQDREQRRRRDAIVTPTDRHPDPNAKRVAVTITDVRTKEKGFIFGRTANQEEVFLHESAFQSETHFVTREVKDVVTVLLVHGKKGFRGHAVQDVEGE